MYVCMYVCIHIYMCACVCVCACVYCRKRIHARIPQALMLHLGAVGGGGQAAAHEDALVVEQGIGPDDTAYIGACVLIRVRGWERLVGRMTPACVGVTPRVHLMTRLECTWHGR